MDQELEKAFLRILARRGNADSAKISRVSILRIKAARSTQLRVHLAILQGDHNYSGHLATLQGVQAWVNILQCYHL